VLNHIFHIPANIAWFWVAGGVACRSWCRYLYSVEYVGFVDNGSGIGRDGTDDDDCGGTAPLRESRWTVGVGGLRFR
jgi:hypothetical protein